MDDQVRAELLKSVFECASDAIIVFDRETLQILDVNPGACEMYGYDGEEFRRLTVLDVTAEPEDTRASISVGANFVVDRLHRRKDGTVFPVEISANHFMADGTPVHFGFVRDISSRVAAEKALVASESKFAAAFRTSPDSVNINRLSDGLYVEVNEGFTAITGFTPQDVADKTSNDIQIWADPTDRERLVAGLKADGRVDDLEADFRAKDGTVRAGLMSARIIEVDGEPCVLSVTHDISRRRAAEIELVRMNERLADIVRQVAEAMGRAVEIRDPYTQGHQERVAHVGTLIASEMGLSEEETISVQMAGLLHDVGKLGVPAELLNKPGKLSEVEFSLITVHSQLGYEILADIPFPWPIAQMVLQHHERMDGSGYPNAIGGDEVLTGSRVLAVADVVEAMASFRPYRPARGLDAAIEEISRGDGRFDSDVVAACVRLHGRGALTFLDEHPVRSRSDIRR